MNYISLTSNKFASETLHVSHEYGNKFSERLLIFTHNKYRNNGKKSTFGLKKVL